MGEPTTSGSAAAAGAVAASTSGTAAVVSFLPPGASLDEFGWCCLFAIFGAFCYQFVEAMMARQKAAEAGTPIDQRPRIDSLTLAYAMCGAPFAAGMLVYIVHFAGGNAGGPLAVPSFMAAGAFSPLVVTTARNLFTRFLGAATKKGEQG